MSQLPNNATVPQIITELQAMTGINNRPELAGQIGGDAQPTDSFAVQLTKLEAKRADLIAAANEADANNSVIKTDIVNKLNAVSTDTALGLTVASPWADIQNAIPQVSSGKRTRSGRVQVTVTADGNVTATVSGLPFTPAWAYISGNSSNGTMSFSGEMMAARMAVPDFTGRTGLEYANNECSGQYSSIHRITNITLTAGQLSFVYNRANTTTAHTTVSELSYLVGE